MENKENITNLEYFGAEDTLSFCNLTMQDYKDSSVDLQSPTDHSSSADQDFFEFERNAEFFSAPDVLFCGKLMHEDQDHNELNEYQKRDYLTNMVRSNSFRRPAAASTNYDDEYPFFNSPSSPRISSNPKPNSHVHSVDSAAYHVQKVNITSLTSMSAKSRRRMFMFGPVKFKPEMELSAIKERQGRRSPTTMLFPPTPVAEGGKAVVSGGGKAAGCGKRSGQWNMVRSLRGRGHLTAVLTRSFGCIPAASWIKMVN